MSETNPVVQAENKIVAWVEAHPNTVGAAVLVCLGVFVLVVVF